MKLQLNKTMQSLRRRALLFACTLGLTGPLMAQGYCLEQSLNNVRWEANQMTKSADNQQFVVGIFNGEGSDPGMYYGKWQKNGQSIWQRSTNPTPHEDGLSSSVSGPNNSMIVVGYTGHINTIQQKKDKGLPLCEQEADLYVAKVNSAGNLVWQSRIDRGCDDYGYDVVRMSETQIVVLGSSYSAADGVFDLYLAWMDETGNLLQERTIHSAEDKTLQGKRILKTSDGGLLILAREGKNLRQPFRASAFPKDHMDEAVLVIRTDASGTILWSRRIIMTPGFGSFAMDGYDMLQDGSGQIYLTGPVNQDNSTIGFITHLSASGAKLHTELMAIDEPIQGFTIPTTLLRQGSELFVSGYVFYGSPVTQWLMNYDRFTFDVNEASAFPSGSVVGSMRNTTSSGTRIFMVGNQEELGKDLDFIKKQVGTAACCEFEPDYFSDELTIIIEDPLLVASSIVLRDEWFFTQPAVPFTPNETDICASSKTISPANSLDAEQPSIFPNPASDQVEIRLPSRAGATQLRIYDVRGQLVMEQALVAGGNILRTADLQTGIYFVELRSGAQVHSEKLLVQH
jgi:hypothetical protein